MGAYSRGVLIYKDKFVGGGLVRRMGLIRRLCLKTKFFVNSNKELLKIDKDNISNFFTTS